MAIVAITKELWLEHQENYIKGSYRNRFDLLSATGKIAMSIPLVGGRDHHRLYRETQITYTTHWQQIHYHALLSCYGSAPFFEHYINYFKPFYSQQYESLFDYNLQLLHLLIKLLKLEVKINLTEEYIKDPTHLLDLRVTFKPQEPSFKLAGYDLREVPYLQVFESIQPFTNHISCIDLLMNEGPHSKEILREMIVSKD